MVYLDTSAVVPLFVPEPASDAIDAWLAGCDETLMASDWLMTEFASALSLKVRRGELGAREAETAWADFEAFCAGGLRLVPTERATFSLAARLVRESSRGLRAGDALHLATAIGAGAGTLATADELLARCAEAQGLAVTRF